jgi:hypothetical protein
MELRGIPEIFKRKSTKANEANTLFGQTALGNNIVYQGDNKRPTVNTQILYVTTSSATDAGRMVDTSLLSRNSTVMSCVSAKARAISQLPIKIMCKEDDGTFVDALLSDKVGVRDKQRAKAALKLLECPNNFQSQYEFWYQWMMWHEMLGEAVDALDLGAGTLFSQIEQLAGVQIGKVTQDIQAIAADARVAAELEVDEGSPVLRILRCYFDPKGRIFEISVSHHPGDRFAYAMHIDVEA